MFDCAALYWNILPAPFCATAPLAPEGGFLVNGHKIVHCKSRAVLWTDDPWMECSLLVPGSALHQSTPIHFTALHWGCREIQCIVV